MTIFERIIKREIPSYIIYEDDFHIAILDINPIKPGHTLVIPKRPVEDVLDMEEESYIKLMLIAKKIAQNMKNKLNTKKIGFAIEGFGVPHVHVHLVPVNEGNDLNPTNAKSSNHEDLENMKNLLTDN